MPIERRCLVPGCLCTGYTFGLPSDPMSEEEEDVVESQNDELQTYCAQCGHSEMEHEMAPSE